MSALIEVHNLGKEYILGNNRVQALRQVSLTIESGEFVAVMGPSGSGKSTFMNLLGCLDRATRGEYRLAGENVAQLDADQWAAIRNQRIGFVFQNFNLLPRTTALDNVQLPLLYTQVPPEERRQRAEQRLRQVGLAERMDHMPSQLSGGQQQRVAIARALINNPLLILADEPTGALDSRTSLEVMALLQELSAQGMTIVVVTHEADIAAYASRNILFRDGSVVRDVQNVPRSARADLAQLPQINETDQIDAAQDVSGMRDAPEVTA